MCKCCKKELNTAYLVTRKLREYDLEFCDYCLLEFERNDISYRKSMRKNSVQFYRSLLREKI